MEFTILPLFSCPVMKTSLDHDYNLIPILESLKYKDTLYQRKFTMSEDLNVLDQLQNLKDGITTIFYKYVSQVLKYPDCKFSISTSWATCTPPGIEGVRHKHYNCWMSGVFYPEDCPSQIRFFKPNTSCFWLGDPSEYNELNSEFWSITPRKNDLIFFESSLEHQILKNESDQNRFSIAFNIVPIGELGYGDSSLNLNINKS